VAIALELIADYPCACGENPMWHPDEQAVYWTDIPAGRLYRFDPASGDHGVCYEGMVVGGFTIQRDGALLLFGADGRVARWRAGEGETELIASLPAELGSRFNDVIADPEGRVFAGTMSKDDRPGRLYRLDPDRSVTVMMEGVGTSNGLAFSPDRSTLYYVDSPKLVVYAFDYDRAGGDLSHCRVLIETDPAHGVPDGLTVDEHGDLWVANWDGWRLEHYTAAGSLVESVEFPVKKVSSALFGGPDGGDLWVTTAGGEDRAANGATAGALYRLRPGPRGPLEFRSAMA
jgi:D-xylonolactonase